MNNEVKTKDVLGSCSSGISAEKKNTISNQQSSKGPISGPSLGKAPTSPTYVATIRTPLDRQQDELTDEMNESLMGFESDNPRKAGRLDRMVSRAQDLSGRAREHAHEMKDNLSHRASDMGHRLSEKASDLGHKASDQAHVATEHTRSTLRSHPGNALLIAAGIGLALGFVLHRRH